MSEYSHEDCPLCGGLGEVTIIPYGEPDSAADAYGCPVCIQAQRDEAESKLAARDAEIAELRKDAYSLIERCALVADNYVGCEHIASKIHAIARKGEK